MTQLEIPPDATAFMAGGKSYYLYMGPLEMVRLQREWGLLRDRVDSAQAWEKKTEEFRDRLDGAAIEDKLSMFRVSMGRCIKAYKAELGETIEIADNEAMAELLQGLEPDGKRTAPLSRMQGLFLRFMTDVFGFKAPAESGEDSADPKAQPSEEGSTPSSS